MKPKEIIAQAKKDVLSGQNRNEVFNRYKGQIPKPVTLAVAISSIPQEEAKRNYSTLNSVLFGILILVTLLKLLSMILLVQGQNATLGFGLVIVGLIIPGIMAIGVFKMEGQVYAVLPILCIAALANILTHFSHPESLIEVGIISIVLGLTLFLKSKLFPTLTWRGPKKDAQGDFIF